MTKQNQDLERLPPSVAKGAIIVGIVVFLFVFIIGMSLLRSCASSSSAPPTTAPATITQRASTDIEVGDTITVGQGTNAFVCPTKADFDECTQLSIAKDYLGLGEMEANGQLYLVDAGTKALVIGESFAAYQVRIESGDYFGKSGWVILESCKK
jgi:hypothetical protein